MRDQIRYSLYSLLEDLISDMKCLDEWSLLVDDREDLIIWDCDESVDLILECLISFIGLTDTCWSFE